VRGDREGSGEVRLPALPPPQPLIIGDEDQLQQVCLNLVMNAVQAMPGGGSLEISLWGLTRRKPGLDRSPPGAYVMLSVSDTGVGIPEADRERIFEPFYSTKLENLDGRLGEGRAGGSGLGLAVSAGIVKDHDGWIEIEPRREGTGGTTFRIYLPAPEPPDLTQEDLLNHGAASPHPEQAASGVAAVRTGGAAAAPAEDLGL
jgi:signal transduction histidine kinase